jgi:hypothetical protein
MQTIITAIYVTALIGVLFGALVGALIHGWGFSMLLKQPKPKFGSRFTLHVLSLVAVGLVMWVIESIFSAPLSISFAIFQMIVYLAALGVVYVALTTKLTQAWYSMSWGDALMSLRILHVLYILVLLLGIGLMVFGATRIM